MALVFERIHTEGIAELSYLVGDDSEGVAAVVDPRADVDCYLELARAKQVSITHIFETHIHADLVSGASELGARIETEKIFVSHEGGARYGFDHKPIHDGDTLVIYENDPDLHFAKGGAVEALERAKKQGKARFVGFTGHKDPAIHLKMLAHEFPFDATFRSFGQKVLPDLNRRGIAPIGMKSLGGTGDAVKRRVVTVREALRYVMSLPIATLVSGIDSLKVLRQNLAIVRSFEPMKPAEMQALRRRCAPQAVDGRFELYKTSIYYDGPSGREQHGFPSLEEVSA